MSRILIALAALLPTLVSTVAPAAGGCALQTALDHRCCAEPTAAPSGSCCSVDAEVARSVPFTTGVSCDCEHRAGVPLAIVADQSPRLDLGRCLDVAAAAQPVGPDTGGRCKPVDVQHRDDPPPRLFLLNASFLT